MLSNPQQMELLLYRVKPLIRLERFFILFEDRRLSVLEILERAVLIWLRPLLLLTGVSSVLRNETQGFLHSPLTSRNCTKNSLADGGGGGGKSSPLPSWLLLAPARVRVICEVATISDYWLMSRDCRWIYNHAKLKLLEKISNSYNKNRGIIIHSRNMTPPIWSLIGLIAR